MLIHNGTVFTSQGVRYYHNLRIEGGRIAEICPATSCDPQDADTIEAQGLYVVPGFIDVHVHGAMGHDTMDASAGALAEMARFLAAHGVTSFLATTMAASRADTLAAVRSVAGYMAAPQPGARVLGVHLEGPFVNPAAKGAQSEAFCRPPDLDEFNALADAGPVRLLTLAPELPGAEAVVRAATARGVTVSIGHTRATYAQAEAAVAWGARQVTHMFNTMSPLHHREPGALGAALTDDRIVAQLIVDGIHLHRATTALAVRAKGPGRVVLVTDAMRAAGLPEGTYELGGQGVIVQDRGCWLTDASGAPTQTLAGSTLTMDAALCNVMRATGLSLAEALPMASSVPATSIGFDDRTGALAPGLWADVTLLDADYRVVATIVGGALAYQAGK